MIVVTDIGAYLERISNALGALRVRSDEAVRASRNGIDAARLHTYAAQLARIADDLEKEL